MALDALLPAGMALNLREMKTVETRKYIIYCELFYFSSWIQLIYSNVFIYNMQKSIKRVFFYSLAVLLLTCCSIMRPEIPENTEFVVEPETFSFATADYDVLPDYHVQAGDILDILFNIQSWNPEKEYFLALGDSISIRFPDAPVLDQLKIKIPPDGMISMPYIGSVKVQGLTSNQLKKVLEKRYAGILRNPDVYIIVDEYLTQLYSLKEDLRTAPRGLSRLATVRPDGYITFPLIGDALTTDKTIPQLNAYINQEYAKISHSLQANLFLQTPASANVYVMGAVNQPGAYAINRPITVLQAITLAGGNTLDSDIEEIFIARRNEKRMVARRINLSDTLNMEKNSTFFFVKPDDIIYVPTTRLADTANAVENIRKIMMFRGWGVNFRP